MFNDREHTLSQLHTRLIPIHVICECQTNFHILNETVYDESSQAPLQ